MAPVLAGAILGWWLFGWRGTLLYSGMAPLFLESIGKALAPLQGLAVGVGGTLETMQLVSGVVLGAVVVSLDPRPIYPSPARPAVP